MANKIIRYPVNEVEDRMLRIEAEKACRRPEQHARYLLRQALGIDEQATAMSDGVDVPMTIELLAAMETLVEFVDKCAEEELASDAVQMSAYIVFSAIREATP